MKLMLCTIFAIVICLSLAMADNITNMLGTVYKNVKITRAEPDGITVMHSGGIAKLFFQELPSDMQQRFGYDPAKATQYRASVQQARSRYNKSISSRRAAQSKQEFPVYVFNILGVKDRSVKNISGVSAYLTDSSITGQGFSNLRRVAGGVYRISFSIKNKTASNLRAIVRFGDFQKEIYLASGGRKEKEEISGDEEYPEVFVIVNGKEKAYPVTWHR